MRRLLDQRDDGYQLFEITLLEDLDLEGLVPMIDRAWRLDYAGEPREEFNEAVLHKLLRGDSWFAVVALARGADVASSSPVGVELALERQLRVRGETLRVFYVTSFSVCPEHRRRGLGGWVLQGVNRCVFEQRGADLIFSTFHQGHAGSPTVQSTFDRIEGWAVARFHQSDIWSRRLDRDPLPPLGNEVRISRVWCPDEQSGRLEAEPCGVGAPAQIELPTLAELNARLQAGFQVSFAFEDSLSLQYLHEDGSGSGTLVLELGDGAAALACYNVLPMKIDVRRLLPVGQLQLVLPWTECSARHMQQIVHAVALHLRDLGCFAVSFVDMGMVPRRAFEALGWLPLEDDGVAFAVRGPASTVSKLEEVQPPYFVDFT